ncbi:MAG: prepilin-type N-terminal cleavage/methylation domain-containing protein [Candidatus Omnitrophota bacterium]
MNKKGFTLIELVMVIVIVGILAAIAIPKFVSLMTNAKVAATQGGLGAIRSAIAISYAKSATSGNPAFPSAITTDLFADGNIPKNALNTFSATAATASNPGSKPTSATAGWWYISASGMVGAFSDGTSETSDW